jgi:hypothetical protein
VMDGVDLAEMTAERAEAARQVAAGETAKQARLFAEKEEAAFKIHVESRAQARADRNAIDAESRKAAETNVDPERWWNDRSTGQKIAGVLAAIVGGLVQGRTGGRNDGMAMIERAIEQDIEAQKVNLANKRGLLGERRQSATDRLNDLETDFRADAVQRATAWANVVKTIEADQANFDPKGTLFQTREIARREAIAKRDAGLAAEEARKIKENEAKAKAKLEQDKFLDEQKHRRAQEQAQLINAKASRTSAGASYLTAKTGAKKADAEIEQQKLENTLRKPEYFEAAYGKDGRPPYEMTAKQHKEWLDNKGKLATAGKDASEASIKASEAVVKGAQARLEKSGPGGSPYAVGFPDGKPVTTVVDGKEIPFEIKDDKQRQEATGLAESAANIRRFADLARIMKKKFGGASEALGSDEAKEMMSIAKSIDFETYKAFGLGAPSAGDASMAEDVRGGNLTSFFKNPSTTLDSYATNVESKANTKLGSLGRVGPPIKFPRVEAAESYERTLRENLDVWEPEELLDPAVPIEEKKKAAVKATESADALAREAEPALLKVLAQQNSQRVADGLLTPAEGAKAQKEFRKHFRRRVSSMMRDMDLEGLSQIGLDALTAQSKFGQFNNSEDKVVDQLMIGAPKEQE